MAIACFFERVLNYLLYTIQVFNSALYTQSQSIQVHDRVLGLNVIVVYWKYQLVCHLYAIVYKQR